MKIKTYYGYLLILVGVMQAGLTQKTILIAPADVVVSLEYAFDIKELQNIDNTTFGRMVNMVNNRSKILTFDKVTKTFCLNNPCSGYPGLIVGSNPEKVSNIACDFFVQFFDSTNKDEKYIMDWGLEGYYLNNGAQVPVIKIEDFRVLSQDRQSRSGVIYRIFKLVDDNNMVLKDTQEIWIVGSIYNPNYNRALTCINLIQFYLDSGCCVTVFPEMVLSGEVYDCWQRYDVKARLWAGNSSLIDRKTNVEGVQLDVNDIGLALRITIIDTITGNSCWSQVTVQDTLPLTIIFPDTIELIADSFICSGRWEIPRPLIHGCSNGFSYTVRSLDGDVLGNETSGYELINLPLGIQFADIIVTNSIGKIARKKVVLKIKDFTPPVTNCLITSTVGLTGNQFHGENLTQINALDLDNKSYDNCQPKVFFKVIRSEELVGTTNGSTSDNTKICNGVNGDDDSTLVGNQIYFDDYSYFCCADLGTSVMVVLRVFDVDPGPGPVNLSRMNSMDNPLYGRFSDCLVEIKVHKDAIPTIVTPPDIVVSCSYNFDLSKATNPSDTQFGRIVTNLSDRRKVVTQDLVCQKLCEKNSKSGYPGFIQTNQVPKPAPNLACDYYNQLFDSLFSDRMYELEWGLDGYVTNSCGTIPTISIQVNDMRQCGQGQIHRIISARGPNSIHSRIQKIWVVECDAFCNCIPFNIDTAHCNDTLYSDIIWPKGVCENKAVKIDECELDLTPNNPKLGKPLIVKRAKNYCTSIAIDYKDKISIINISSSKIERTWTVTDLCKYNETIDTSFGKWSKVQEIIVQQDTIAPVVRALRGIITVPMPSSGCITVWAKSLDHGSFDNCTAKEDLLVYFNGDVNTTSITVCCDDFVNAGANDELVKTGKMWVVDENGNRDYRVVWFLVQDNQNICPNVSNSRDLNKDNSIVIYPNPSKGNIIIQSLKAMNQVRVFTFDGTIYADYPKTNHHLFSINDLPSGVYIIETFANGKRLNVKKVIVNY